MGRIHHRTPGYKWSLLKVRKGKYKKEYGGAQTESGGQETASLLTVPLKLKLTSEKGGTR
jgi:hypothetical protein